MKKIYIVLFSLLAFTPAVSFAAGMTLRDLVEKVIGYFQVAVTLIISLAILTFIWNIYKYFIKADPGAEKKEAGNYVLYSVVGFFVILSLWGLVAIVRNTFNLPDYKPDWPFVGGSKNLQNNDTEINDTFRAQYYQPAETK